MERSDKYWALSRCGVLSLIIHIFALRKKTQPIDFNGSSAADFKKDFPFGAELQDKQEGETCFRADLANVKLWCLKSSRLFVLPEMMFNIFIREWQLLGNFRGRKQDSEKEQTISVSC